MRRDGPRRGVMHPRNVAGWRPRVVTQADRERFFRREAYASLVVSACALAFGGLVLLAAVLRYAGRVLR